MAQDVSLLDRIVIASPCTASWAGMKGDERVRFCDSCKLNVYNLSAMSRDEAEQLVREKEGRLCVRFYQRRDGTVLTRDCPVGLRAIRTSLRRCLAAIGTTAAILIGTTYVAAGRDDVAVPLSWLRPFRDFMEWLDPPVHLGGASLPSKCTVGSEGCIASAASPMASGREEAA